MVGNQDGVLHSVGGHGTHNLNVPERVAIFRLGFTNSSKSFVKSRYTSSLLAYLPYNTFVLCAGWAMAALHNQVARSPIWCSRS